MGPALFRDDEFTREMNRLRMQGRASLEAVSSEVKRIDRELDTLLNLFLKGGAAERINTKMVELEARKAEWERVLTEAEEPPPLLHPEMATFYRGQVMALHLALGEGQEEDRAEAAERLRSLVSKIILTPDDGRLTIDVQGDLAGILAIAHADRPTGADTTVSQTAAAGRRQFSFPNRDRGEPHGSSPLDGEPVTRVRWRRECNWVPTFST